MKRIFLLVLIAVLTSCGIKPQRRESTSNPDVSVRLLFEHDGVKVYRFSDFGHAVYYTDARGRTQWEEKQGKTTKRYSLETVE